MIIKLLNALRLPEAERTATHSTGAYTSPIQAVYGSDTDNTHDIYKPSTSDRESHIRYIKPCVRGNMGGKSGMRAAVNACAMALAVYATATGSTEQALGAWGLMAAVLIATDPIDVFKRVLAPQTRVAIVTIICLSMISVISDSGRVIAVTGALTVVLLPVCRIKNNEWLMLANWNMSTEVEKAMRIDADNRAAAAWQYGGRKSAYTLLHELGYAYKNYDLDGYAKPLYFLGYWTGCKYGGVVESLETENRVLRGEIDNLKQQMQQLPRADRELIEENEELEYINECLNKLVRELQEKIDQNGKEAENKLDTSSIEHETNAKTEDLEIGVRSQELIEDIVINSMSEDRLSIQKAAVQFGCKRWIVQHVREAIRDFENGETLEAVAEHSRLNTEELETIFAYVA